MENGFTASLCAFLSFPVITQTQTLQKIRFFCGLKNYNSENADLEISESLFKGKEGGGGLTGEEEQRLRGSFVGKFGDCRMIRTLSPMEDREKSGHA